MENLTSNQVKILDSIKKTLQKLDKIQLLEVTQFAQNLKKMPQKGER